MLWRRERQAICDRLLRPRLAREQHGEQCGKRRDEQRTREVAAADDESHGC